MWKLWRGRRRGGRQKRCRRGIDMEMMECGRRWTQRESSGDAAEWRKWEGVGRRAARGVSEKGGEMFPGCSGRIPVARPDQEIRGKLNGWRMVIERLGNRSAERAHARGHYACHAQLPPGPALLVFVRQAQTATSEMCQRVEMGGAAVETRNVDRLIGRRPLARVVRT